VEVTGFGSYPIAGLVSSNVEALNLDITTLV
jgi:hypothetical protein